MSGDDGAATTLVVVLLSTGVLLGLGAVVVDYGAQQAERRQVQNGADAAALALAQQCAADPACAPTAADAQQWVDLNDSVGDTTGMATVHSVGLFADAVCVPGGGQCPGPDGGGALTECLPTALGLAPDVVGSVEVRVQSEVPPLMGSVLGSDGTSAAACARASWGPVDAVEDAFVVGVPECAVLSYDVTIELVVTAPPEPGVPPVPTADPVPLTCAGGVAISVAVGGGVSACWADVAAGDVLQPIDVDDVAACLGGVADGVVLWLPVFDVGASGDAPPTVRGFVGFVPDGDAVRPCAAATEPPEPPEPPVPLLPPPPPPPEPVPPAQVCVVGAFTMGTPPGGLIGTAVDYGARAVQLTG